MTARVQTRLVLRILVLHLASVAKTSRAQALFDLPEGTQTQTVPLTFFVALRDGPLVERTDRSRGGFLIDATGDGTADDVFVANVNQANEVLLHDGAGGYSRLTSGPLVERTDNSRGGFLFDATGDGTADDVFVVNYNQANEVLLHDGAGGYSRLTSGPLVERTDNSQGGFLIDATGDGTADDVFVANGNQANEVLLHDGAGGYSRLTSG
eukprot:COSAG02_NODE_495_length_21151_cov_31.954256_22_plen_209_part_01